MRVSKGAVDTARGGGFRLNGKPITAIASGSIESQVRRVAERLPDDELLDVEEMAVRIGHLPGRLSNNGAKLDRAITTMIRVGTRQRRVFGNPKTIKKLLAGLERA